MIEIKDLSFKYNKHEVLNDINLTINPGDYLALIGSNGSGKSTLVKLILGLLQPQEGTLKQTFSRVAYIPQQGLEDVSFPITVYEMLKFRLPRKQSNHDHIMEALNTVGLSDVSKSLVKNLSGGQRQRVLIARELLINPDLMILDEPHNGLDQKSIASLYKLLRKLNQEAGVTIILVTHHMDDKDTKNLRVVKFEDHSISEVAYV